MNVDTEPCFNLNVSGSLKILQVYHEKYDGIDRVLDMNANILDAFHTDLQKYGSVGDRKSKYSSEQMDKETSVDIDSELYFQITETVFQILQKQEKGK